MSIALRRNMTRRPLKVGMVLLKLTFSAAFLTSSMAYAQENVRISVTLDDLKLDGSTWDVGNAATGKGSTSVGVPISSSPPDITACVIDTKNTITCSPAPSGGQLVPKCIDLFYCDIPISIPSNLPFGLLIFDVDPKAPDIVDYVIMSGPEDDPADLSAIEAALRRRVDEISPAFMPWTKKRRQKNAVVNIPYIDCLDQEAPCRALQSRFSFEVPE